MEGWLKKLDLTLKDYKPLVKFVNSYYICCYFLEINKIKANQELQKYFYDKIKGSPQVILYE